MWVCFDPTCDMSFPSASSQCPVTPSMVIKARLIAVPPSPIRALKSCIDKNVMRLVSRSPKWNFGLPHAEDELVPHLISIIQGEGQYIDSSRKVLARLGQNRPNLFDSVPTQEFLPKDVGQYWRPTIIFLTVWNVREVSTHGYGYPLKGSVGNAHTLIRDVVISTLHFKGVPSVVPPRRVKP